MRTAQIALLALLLVVLIGTACRHPVQLVPRDYTVPQQWARIGCVARGDMLDGSPVLVCPDGLRMISRDGTLEAFVSNKEIGK